MAKSSGEPSPEQVARVNRQRLAAAEGAQAMEEVARRAADVRANMARLRALRLAKEATAAHDQSVTAKAQKPKPTRRKSPASA
jgi:hypothetical protein